MRLHVIPGDCGLDIAVWLAGGNVHVILKLVTSNWSATETDPTGGMCSEAGQQGRQTLEATTGQGMKCRLGRLKKMESMAGTLHVCQRVSCCVLQATHGPAACQETKASACALGQDSLAHLEECELHAGAVHALLGLAVEGLHHALDGALVGCIVVGGAGIPAPCSIQADSSVCKQGIAGWSCLLPTSHLAAMHWTGSKVAAGACSQL